MVVSSAEATPASTGSMMTSLAFVRPVQRLAVERVNAFIDDPELASVLRLNGARPAVRFAEFPTEPTHTKSDSATEVTLLS